jgi:hypothetical protein
MYKIITLKIQTFLISVAFEAVKLPVRKYGSKLLYVVATQRNNSGKNEGCWRLVVCKAGVVIC